MVEKPIEGQNMAIFLQSEPMRGGLGVGTLKELAGECDLKYCFTFCPHPTKLFYIQMLPKFRILEGFLRILFMVIKKIFEILF
jgi:hypothetical protein